MTGAAAGLASFSSGDRLPGAPWVDLTDHSIRRATSLTRFGSSYDEVLGTSFDLIIEAGRQADAVECESRIVAEIERLRAELRDLVIERAN